MDKKIENVLITKINVTDKDRNGVPLKGKYGPYLRVGIQTEQHGTKWLSGFANNRMDKMANLEVGQEYSILTWMNREYLNFSMPKQQDYVPPAVDLAELKRDVMNQGAKIQWLQQFQKKVEAKFPEFREQKLEYPKDPEIPRFEIDGEEVPF